MSNRWPHRIAGFVCYLIFFTVCITFIVQGPIPGKSGIFIHLGVTDVPWIAVGLAMSVFGAELPDYDQYRQARAHKKKGKGDDHKVDNDNDPKKGTTTQQEKNKFKNSRKIMGSVTTHRSGLTHSPLIPVCILIPALAVRPAQGAFVAIILMIFFWFGHASHLLLDMRPSRDARPGKDQPKGEKKKKATPKPRQTSYCLHFGIKGHPLKQGTKALLASFGIIEILLGILMLWIAS